MDTDGIWSSEDGLGFVWHYGLGFVWYGGLGGGAGSLELQEGGDAAVVYPVVMGLVPVKEPDCGGIGEFVDGIEEILAVAAGRFDIGEFGIEEDYLHSVGAPGGGDHFLNDIHFDVVGGEKAGDVLVEVRLEVGGVLFVEDDAFGEEALAECILGGFAKLGSFWPDHARR
jgi:hypothetical protein